MIYLCKILILYIYNQHRYHVLDKPGLDDFDNNDKTINALKNI